MDIFSQIIQLLGSVLGYVMWFIYTKIVSNYGIALLIFTMLTRIIMIPISINQQKGSAKMAALQPEINALREKHGKDNQRLQEEMSKLYQREGYNPMSGCLPMLIQFPILFGLIDVIYHPLSHILRLDKAIIAKGITLFELLGNATNVRNMLELEFTKSLIDKPVFYSLLGSTVINEITKLDYTFLGMDLMAKPSLSMITGIFSGGFNPVIFIPILSGITAFLSSKFTMGSNSSDPATAGMTKSMTYTMPLLSFWIAFSVPAGVGLYWVYSNIFAMIQGMFMNKFFNPAEMREKMKQEAEERRKQEQLEREEARKLKKEGLLDEKDSDKAMTLKQINNAKLAEARKRDAEKYGEE